MSSLDETTRTGMMSANYAQNNHKEKFKDQGRFKHWEIDDVVRALRDRTLTPKDVVVDFVLLDGHWLMQNTRSPQVLLRAGIPKEQWYGRDMTGIRKAEKDVRRQLFNSGLTSEGTPTVESRDRRLKPGDEE
jgi:hypothetical protein